MAAIFHILSNSQIIVLFFIRSVHNPWRLQNAVYETKKLFRNTMYIFVMLPFAVEELQWKPIIRTRSRNLCSTWETPTPSDCMPSDKSLTSPVHRSSTEGSQQNCRSRFTPAGLHILKTFDHIRVYSWQNFRISLTVVVCSHSFVHLHQTRKRNT